MSKKHTTTTFIEAARQLHGNKYNYNKVEYLNAHANVIITCPKHGDFKQQPNAHLGQKQGCPKCGLENRKLPHKKNTEQFVKEAIAKWGDKYDYSITEYNGKLNKLKYICKTHGIIEQMPYRHIRCGCPFCNGRGISHHSKTSFVNIANKIHENKYDYSKTNFLRMNDVITITCPQHGDFEQRAGNHIHLQNGCPQCAKEIRTSSGEKEVLNFILKHYKGLVLTNDRNALDGKEIDIYIPELKLGIEYHGLYWHLETVRGRKHHYDKWVAATVAGIRLVQIYSNEWESKRAILESKILNLLGVSEKIGARETKVVEIDRATKDDFLEKNHLQGQDSSKIWYGLYHNEKLVSCMTFGPSRFNKQFKFELVRFCNARGVSIVGGAGKLLAAFRKTHKGSIISYADKRYSTGNLYKQLGFKLDGETQPSFMYVNIKNNQTYNRMKFQKQYLKGMPHYSPTLTEYEIMQLNGYDRIWDAGQYRFILES